MGCHSFKTGNVFVTESFPEYTISCFFTACSGEKINEVITGISDAYAILPVLAFSVLSLETEIMIARESSSVSPENINAFKVVKKTIEQLYPNAIVSSYITVGGTDAYQYQAVSDNIYRFLPIDLNLYEQRTMHNENEHITIDNYGKMIWYFQELMKTYQNGQN